MSLFWRVYNSLLFQTQKMAINILKCGPIPRHVAIIMDGNRRFAVKNKMSKKEGHSFGFETLKQVTPIKKEKLLLFFC